MEIDGRKLAEMLWESYRNGRASVSSVCSVAGCDGKRTNEVQSSGAQSADIAKLIDKATIVVNLWCDGHTGSEEYTRMIEQLEAALDAAKQSIPATKYDIECPPAD